jgi:hypothetical protein
MICESTHIIPAAPISDASGTAYAARDHSIRIATKPNALLFNGMVESRIQAFICGECGYIASFVEHPKQLYQAYLAYVAATTEE